MLSKKTNFNTPKTHLLVNDLQAEENFDFLDLDQYNPEKVDADGTGSKYRRSHLNFSIAREITSDACIYKCICVHTRWYASEEQSALMNPRYEWLSSDAFNANWLILCLFAAVCQAYITEGYYDIIIAVLSGAKYPLEWSQSKREKSN